MKRIFIFIAIVFILLAAYVWSFPTATSQAQSPVSQTLNVRTPSGNVAHNFPPRQWYAQHRLLSPTDNSSYMTYHNGPIMQSVATYAIYWTPTPTYTLPSTYQFYIERYLTDVGGSPYYGIMAQYYQTAPQVYIQNKSQFVASDTYTAPYPHAGTAGDPLQDADIQAAVTAMIQANGWPTGLGAMYFVFTAKGIESCDAPTSCTVGTSYPMYCGYHSSFFYNSDWVVYANMPYNATWDGLTPTCSSPAFDTTPNDHDSDEEISVLAHEQFEATTDPLVNAWYDSSGNTGEIGDKCAFHFGAQAGDGHNLILNRNLYIAQLEWSNRQADGVTPYQGCSNGNVNFFPFLSFGN